jgi:signal transduction histidine kinase
VNIDCDPGLEANIDASLVLQALANLLDNAAKFSPPAGSILLSAERRGGDVEIAVEDDGAGVAQEDRSHVFERFYRSRRDAARVKGSGLGLALVKGFVELSGGSVRLDATDAGSRFVMAFPISTPIGLTA